MVQSSHHNIRRQIVSNPEGDHLSTRMYPCIGTTGRMDSSLSATQLDYGCLNLPLNGASTRLPLVPGESGSIILDQRCQFVKLHLFNQFQLSHFSRVAKPRADTHKPYVPAGPARVPAGEIIKHLLCRLLLRQEGHRAAPRRKVAGLSERDDALRQALHFLGFGNGRHHLLVFDEFRYQIAIQGKPMFRRPVQLSSCYSVSHFDFPFDFSGMG